MTDSRTAIDELVTWGGVGSTAGPADDRARFTSISATGNSTHLTLRDIQADVIRDGTGDWRMSYTDEAGRTWEARSDTYTGGVLTLLARMCGLDGEIRGHLADEEPA